ncbi:hypothetical protein [Pedobacter miscanthi]|jgi:hypothetical protein|uniref:hypothetical protein n=1 Tax=Pedobacter miscanthi TaxID=2259170 RepID=UPI00292D49A8|nr:hypothetical protein [Pedobacter miscanthi]
MKYTFYTLLCLGTLLFSCNKSISEDDVKSDDKSCKIVSIQRKVVGYDGMNSAAISYNEDNTIKSIISTSDSSFKSFTVIYAVNKVTLKTRYYGDYTYNLDSKKRVVSATFGEYGNKFEYLYNTDGFISEIVEVDRSSGFRTTFNLFYAKGNLIKVTFKEIYGDETTIDFVYDEGQGAAVLLEYTDPLYYIGTYSGEHYVIPGVFGETSKNLLTSAISTRRSPNGYIGREAYSLSYKKDGEKRISSIELTAPYLSEKSTYNFIYDCK